MRRLLLVGLVPLLLASGCGGGKARSPEQVVRAWSDAVNANRNDAAADLFAADAKVVQSEELVLHTHADAVRWNEALPCAGAIDSVTTRDNGDLLVTFTLGERPQHRCDGPGSEAAAIFRVAGGKISLFHQTDVPGGGTPVIGGR